LPESKPYEKADVEPPPTPVSYAEWQKQHGITPSTAPGTAFAPSPEAVAGAQSKSVNITVNQTLPPGTPEEHAAIVKESTQNLFNLYLGKHLRDTLSNYPAVP
jgi:hypothetical protein